MKKTKSFLSTIMVVLSFVSCSSFSSKKVEGYWWHNWGADGYDYVYLKPNGLCDYDFGQGQKKDCRFNITEAVRTRIDNNNLTISLHNNYGEEKTLIYDKKRDVLVEPNTCYEMERMPKEYSDELSNANKTSSSYGSESYSAQSYNSSSNKSNHYDDSSTKWEEFAGTTYRASQWVSDRMQYYAFSYNRSGKGKYFIYCNYPGTNVVEDKMEFSIYKVESNANYLYLYSYELNSPVKIKIQGITLYTMNGDRYEIWR